MKFIACIPLLLFINTADVLANTLQDGLDAYDSEFKNLFSKSIDDEGTALQLSEMIGARCAAFDAQSNSTKYLKRHCADECKRFKTWVRIRGYSKGASSANVLESCKSQYTKLIETAEKDELRASHQAALESTPELTVPEFLDIAGPLGADFLDPPEMAIDLTNQSVKSQMANYLKGSSRMGEDEEQCLNDSFLKVRALSYWNFYNRSFEEWVDRHGAKAAERFGSINRERIPGLCRDPNFISFLVEGLPPHFQSDSKPYKRRLEICELLSERRQREYSNQIIGATHVCWSPRRMAIEKYPECWRSNHELKTEEARVERCECVASEFAHEYELRIDNIAARRVLANPGFNSSNIVAWSVKAMNTCRERQQPLSHSSVASNAASESLLDIQNDSALPTSKNSEPDAEVSEKQNSVSVKKAVQIELRRLGLYSGPIDGVLGGGSNRAIAKFNQAIGGDVSSTDLPVLLATLQRTAEEDIPETFLEAETSEKPGTILGQTLQETGQALGKGAKKTGKWLKEKLKIKDN